MTEAKATAASVEKFEFKWSSSGQPNQQAAASATESLPAFEPMEYSVEAPAEVDASMEVAEDSPTEAMATVEPSHSMESYPPVDEHWLGSYRSSPKSGKKLSFPSLSSIQPAMKVRLVGVVVWSAVAGAGAGELVLNGGSTLIPKIGVLVGVWGAINVAIWFLGSRLTK